MNTSLSGKVALITGASRGIGKAIAVAFAKQGCNIAFTSRSENANMEETLSLLASYGVKAKGYASDAAVYDDVQKVVDAVIQEFGAIQILVNNAGITNDGLLLRMNEKQWDEVIAANLKSVFNFTKLVLPIMAKQRSGSIINISSVVGMTGNAGQTNYAASKAGIIGFTKSVAKEMGGRNIRCNALAPGFIETDMTQSIPEELKKVWIEQIPLKRSGKSEDVANAALFLASDLSSYISGQTISICGAMNT